MDFTAVSLTLSPHPSQSFFSASYPGDLESTHAQVVVGFLTGTMQNGAFFICMFLSLPCELRLSCRLYMRLIMILSVGEIKKSKFKS